jgi:hypothetical protein
MKKLLLIGCSAFLFSGCMTSRFVTTQTWVGDETLYVAYTQYDDQIITQSFESKVLRCVRESDNKLKCGDENELNALLNKGSATAK